MTVLVLASGSKARADMLQHAGVPFETARPMVDEDALKDALMADKVPARDMADALAELKARSVSLVRPDDLVLGADQILELDGRIFSKAKNRESARETLAALSGRGHTLFSAAVVYRNGEALWRFVDAAKMHMRPLGKDFTEQYLDEAGDIIFHSVGCYQVEGRGVQLFTRIDGSHYTVLGLPLLHLLDFLRRHGILAI